MSPDPDEVLEDFKKLAELALEIVPVEDLKGLLDEKAKERADAIADAAEKAKFG